MKARTIPLVFLVLLAVSVAQAQTAPQACKDEETMVEDSMKNLTDLVGTVKKETVGQFESKFHQKTSVSDLTFLESLLDQADGCLDKASQDSTATKDQQAAYKAKRDAYSKLKERLETSRSAIKAAEASKNAKALVEKLDLSTTQ